MPSSSSASSKSNSRATSREDLKASTPANEDGSTLPAKCETGDTATLGHVSSDVLPSENHREERHYSEPSSTASVRHRSKTHTQLIKEKLDQIKAEMQKISKVHLHQRPERKPYHPFVWNALSPYRDTTEIDHLLAMVQYLIQKEEFAIELSNRKLSMTL